LGLQGDIADPRSKSFLFILDLLPRLCKLPGFILLENVKGFESSSARYVTDNSRVIIIWHGTLTDT
ncbi:tRNA (cytosine-5-)-methyltransferase, partial [Ameca splendens]